MNRYFTNSFKSTLARIFLFLAIVKGIDIGLVQFDSFCSSALPWEPNTEYFQETDVFQDFQISSTDFYDLAGLTKTPVAQPNLSGIVYPNRKFFIYQQRLPKQENLSYSSISFFLVTSKSNIPHLNLDDEVPLALA